MGNGIFSRRNASIDILMGLTMLLMVFEQFFNNTYEIAGGHHLSEAGARKIMTEIAPALFFGK